MIPSGMTWDPGPDGAYEECVHSCVAEIPELDLPCQVGLCEAFACYGALDCATLDAGSPECEAMFEAVDECVIGDECVSTDAPARSNATCAATPVQLHGQIARRAPP